MDGGALRVLQRPLKERYRADPASALVTLKAQGTLGEEAVTCTVDTGRALVEAGLHPATGATGCPSARVTCRWRRRSRVPA